MSSVNVQDYIDTIELINNSKVLETINKAEAVEINSYGFCRHFNVYEDALSEALDNLKDVVSSSDGTQEDGEQVIPIDDIINELYFEASFVDDDTLEKFEYLLSIQNMINATILEDGNVKIQDLKNIDGEDLILTFYQLKQV